MKYYLLLISLFVFTTVYPQQKFQPGVFETNRCEKQLILNNNGTFEVNYYRGPHPVFSSDNGFSETGVWQRKGDTIILNSHLEEKTFIEQNFSETIQHGDTDILLTINIIKRKIDANGNITLSDTTQADRADYWFNDRKENEIVRIAKYPTTRCAFAGPVPKIEKVTNSRTVITIKPSGPLKKIHIGCYEYNGTKEFAIKDTRSNRLTLNIYHNYYAGGFIRSKKILIKNNNKLLCEQNEKGKFYTDTWWDHHSKLKRQKISGPPLK